MKKGKAESSNKKGITRREYLKASVFGQRGCLWTRQLYPPPFLEKILRVIESISVKLNVEELSGAMFCLPALSYCYEATRKTVLGSDQ